MASPSNVQCNYCLFQSSTSNLILTFQILTEIVSFIELWVFVSPSLAVIRFLLCTCYGRQLSIRYIKTGVLPKLIVGLSLNLTTNLLESQVVSLHYLLCEGFIFTAME